MNRIKTSVTLFLLLLTTACCNKEHIVSIEGGNIAVTASPAEECSQELKALLQIGEMAVDSIKSPIIGTAATTLKAFPPESPLMNFAADALLAEARGYSQQHIDIAITNKGGLRSDLNEGVITFGDVYNVFPFENTLVILSLNGEQLIRLFNDIAKAGGEAISGAQLVIVSKTELVDAKVNNQKIIPDKEYRIATSDYLAQGNDKLYTLAKGYNRNIYTVTIRDLMINHIAKLHKEGKAVNAKVDGRIKETIPAMICEP